MSVTYEYRVRDPLGTEHEGILEAANADEASQQLRREGFQIVELDEEREELSLLPRRVSKSELIYVTSQLAIMVDTGITLSAALQGIIAEEQNPTLRKVLNELKIAVEGGEDFSTALERHPRMFDKTYVALVKASEATGSLGTMLDRVVEYMRKELETRNKVRAAMAYPAVMMTLAVSVTIFLLAFVMPKFTPLFNRKGVELPKPTVVMMTVSSLLTEYWYLWLAGLVLLIVGFLVGRRTEQGRKTLDGAKLNLPIFGGLVRKVIISRSIRTFGTLLASGVPMLESLRLSADVCGNYYYEKIWRHVSERVTSGAQIFESLTGQKKLFPPMLVQMIKAGEESGQLEKVLERVSDYYDQEVDNTTKTATSLIEPIMITVMGVIVGGIALALLLPIFTLSKAPG